MNRPYERVDDLSSTNTGFSDSVKYYATVILSTLFGTLLFAFVASTTYTGLPFFAFICGVLSLTVGVFGSVMVGTKMISEYEDRH
ncbi:hypothetical protein LCGC14_2096620 [marine sediment metagenome]|uniref:Uncharacterized protein n=1 Tax=marine sediment metagenome TaxID=412755 RepID=A0A0F9EYH9_9ZZZZ